MKVLVDVLVKVSVNVSGVLTGRGTRTAVGEAISVKPQEELLCS